MVLFKNPKLKYLIVANDAGAAYQIYYLIKKFNLKCSYYLKGPAKKIFKKKNIVFLDKEIKKNDVIITGTSLKTDHEKKVIKKCKLYKKKVFSIFDNYNNFKKRFLLNKKIFYPNIIITIDDLSFKEARKYKKKNFLLIKKKDYYLDYIKKIKKKSLKKNIIYFSSNYDRISKNPIDLKLFKSFYLKLEKIKLIDNKKNIYIKIHPSENRNKYLRSQILRNLKIKIVKDLDIVNILKNFQIAGGCETYALALAKAFGLKVFNNIENFHIRPKLGRLYKIKKI